MNKKEKFSKLMRNRTTVTIPQSASLTAPSKRGALGAPVPVR